jgi:hypothetical protein
MIGYQKFKPTITNHIFSFIFGELLLQKIQDNRYFLFVNFISK